MKMAKNQNYSVKGDRALTRPEALALGGRDLVPDLNRPEMTSHSNWAKGQQHVEGEPAHRRRGIKLLWASTSLAKPASDLVKRSTL
jgi:hypothetical protein